MFVIQHMDERKTLRRNTHVRSLSSEWTGRGLLFCLGPITQRLLEGPICYEVYNSVYSHPP